MMLGRRPSVTYAAPTAAGRFGILEVDAFDGLAPLCSCRVGLSLARIS
jgi:hypothetical protein